MELAVKCLLTAPQLTLPSYHSAFGLHCEGYYGHFSGPNMASYQHVFKYIIYLNVFWGAGYLLFVVLDSANPETIFDFTGNWEQRINWESHD